MSTSLRQGSLLELARRYKREPEAAAGLSVNAKKKNPGLWDIYIYIYTYTHTYMYIYIYIEVLYTHSVLYYDILQHVIVYLNVLY